MISTCRLCGCTEADSIADAKTLGLEEELQNGVYTCCQIAAWAHEQPLAWFEATKFIVVTGASKGIGRATADALVEQGYAKLVNNCTLTIYPGLPYGRCGDSREPDQQGSTRVFSKHKCRVRGL